MQKKLQLCCLIPLSIFFVIVIVNNGFSFSFRHLQRREALIPRVTSASPNPAKLEIGGSEISVALKGSYLNLVTGLTILQGDRVVPSTEITISLAGTPTQTAATINLKASSQAVAGTDYRLRAAYGVRSVDISTSTLSIELYKISLGPIKITPTIPKKDETPGILMVNKTTLRSNKFGEIIAKIFANGYFLVNSGWNQNQITLFSVPNLCYVEEPFQERLDYPFNENEKESCACVNPMHSIYEEHTREAIRAYLNNQKTSPWLGAIEQGKLKIELPFTDKRFIKTRAHDTHIGDSIDWDEANSDRYIADYCCIGLGMDVIVGPKVNSGNLTYSDVNVTWANLSSYEFSYSQDNDARPFWGYWCLGNTEQNLIIAYRDKINEILRSRVKNFFSRDDVRNYIVEALNKEIKSGIFEGLNIVSITGMGSELTITFDKYVQKY